MVTTTAQDQQAQPAAPAEGEKPHSEPEPETPATPAPASPQQNVHGPAAPVFGGDNHGPINTYVLKPDEHDPVDGPVESERVKLAKQVFCPPEGFHRAKKTLAEDYLVVLRGHGSGRSHAALRLLADTCDGAIQRLDPSRRASDFKPAKAVTTRGYVWDGVGPGWVDGPLHRVLADLRARLHEANARLVVVGDNLDTTTAGSVMVELQPPPIDDVARAHLLAQNVAEDRYRALLAEVKTDGDIYLGDSPSLGKRMAECLADLHYKRSDLATTRAELGRVDNQDIEQWFNQADLADRALAITIAFFERARCQPTLSMAQTLADILANPESEEIWPYDPPDLFEMSIEERLRRANAVRYSKFEMTELSDRHIRFIHRSWGRRLLAYVWRQYDRVRPILQDWLVASFGEVIDQQRDQPAQRFGRMLVDAEQGDAFTRISGLTDHDNNAARRLGAMALNGLGDRGPRLVFAQEQLVQWTLSKRMPRRIAAAMAWQGPLGYQRPELTMHALRILANRADIILELQVRQAIRALLAEPNHRPIVQRALMEWEPRNHSAKRSFRNYVILAIGLWDSPSAGFCDDAEAFQALLANLLLDDAGRKRLTDGFNKWCRVAELDHGLRPYVDQLLRTALNGPDSVVNDRLAFVLRKALYLREEELESLRNALIRTI